MGQMGTLFLLVANAWLATCFKLQGGIHQQDVSGLVGETVSMPCIIDTRTCGHLHSIKWYRGSSRISVFSPINKYEKSEGDYSERSKIEYASGSTMSYLQIKNVALSDEAIYKCEITYLDVVDSCLVVQFINLTTLVRPNWMAIFDEAGSRIENEAIIGPFNEGDQLILTCETAEGKPIPAVVWYNGTSRLPGFYEAMEDGLTLKGSARNKLQVEVSRGDLGTTYQCRVMTPALPETLVSSVNIDVNVKPSSISVQAPRMPFENNRRVRLKCEVTGARPAATISWFNETSKLDDQPPVTILTSNFTTTDGTSTTVSELSFIATRFENDLNFYCEASNQVSNYTHSLPLMEKIPVVVYYAPIVTVSSDRSTVNQSSDVALACSFSANPLAEITSQWYFNGADLWSSPAKDHYETSPNGNLFIKKATKEASGNYTCSVKNIVGTSSSTNHVYVNVLYPPVVNVTIHPARAIIEKLKENVTLRCVLSAGNPREMLSVRWYNGSQLIADWRNCSSINDLQCNPTLDTLVIAEANRYNHGYYSCEAETVAATAKSPWTLLQVHYAPGPATLSYKVLNNYGEQTDDEIALKGSSIVLMCKVDAVGRPANLEYRWYRGGVWLRDVHTANYTISSANIHTRSIFTCQGENKAGFGPNGTVFVDVRAMPNFINQMPHYKTASIFDTLVNLTCHIECYPRCHVNWWKDDQLITDQNERYIIITENISENVTTNDFESVRSTLVWNLAAFPGGRLNQFTDNGRYSCNSTANNAGRSVGSTTEFTVEYPPTDISLTQEIVHVSEGNEPGRIICNVTALPPVTYRWFNESEVPKGRVFQEGQQLQIKAALSRFHGANYTCEASNKHGSVNKTVQLIVDYAPVCQITRTTDEEGRVELQCHADGNPPELDFTWSVADNQSLTDTATSHATHSSLLLDESVDTERIYSCVVNNTVGSSNRCWITVPPSSRWWHFLILSDYRIYLAIIIAIVLMVTIICVIIVLVCRKRRKQEKSNGKNRNMRNTPSDALLQPDSDKAFYENLPFHGMQHPPNQKASVNCESPNVSIADDLLKRPPSEQSQFGGSSGYGSTRSQKLVDQVQQTQNSDFSSLRKRNCRLSWSFRSLRTPKRAFMLPIKENASECTKICPPPRPPKPKKYTPVLAKTENGPNLNKCPPEPSSKDAKNKTFAKESCDELTANSNIMEYIQLTQTQHRTRANRTQRQTHNETLPARRRDFRVLDEEMYREPPPPPAPESYHPHYSSSKPGGDNVAYSHRKRTSRKKSHRHNPEMKQPSPHQYSSINDYGVIKFHDVGAEIDV